MSSLSKKLNIGGDKIIWRIVIFLALFSILPIYSSVSALAYRSATTTFALLSTHIVHLILCFVVLYIAHRLPVSVYKNFAFIGLLISIGLMVYMLFFGVNLNDGQRWIKVLGFTFQPADITKISLIIYIAATLEDNPTFKDFKDVLWKIVLPIGLIFLLIFIGNISTALMIGVISIATLFVGGLELKHLGKILLIGCAVLLVLIVMGTVLKWPPRVVTATSRFESFFKKDEDASGKKVDKRLSADYQKTQAKIAIASGGLFGKGPGNSTQRYLLPEPYSDFVFAIIIEEYGLFIGVLMLLAYMALLYRAVVIAKKCTRIFSSVTVIGLMLLIILQAMINMGVSVSIFPVTGQPLPFISRGGSSLLFTGLAIGIILSISRAANKQEELAQQADNENDNEIEIIDVQISTENTNNNG